MKIAILGFEREGRAALEFFSKQGDEITICDQQADKEIPDGVASHLGPDYLKDLDKFDLLIRTPYLKPRDILAVNPDVADKISSGVNQFFKLSPTKNIIGVTGTKGKGTTSTMITKMLEAAGKRVFLAGNIGLPALELLKQDLQPDDWVVLELSSYQLIDLQASPHIAVCLMVVPEHLDWHIDFDEYVTAKQQISAHQTADDITVYYANNDMSIKIASASPGKQIPYYRMPGAFIENDGIVIDGEPICKTDELKLLGQHNWQNACAAVTAVWQIAPDVTALRSVLTSFTGLPHRLELVREYDEVYYYNDSFASAPDAAAASLEAIAGQKVIILGGFDRQLPIDHLAKALQEHTEDIRQAVLIGASAERLAEACKAAGFTKFSVSDAKTMPEVVAAAAGFAQAGDAVVLSPGFPSFDMFKNFEDRGDQFRAAVKAL